MADLIDRQALIDAHYDYCNEHHGKADVFYAWSLELMRNAPSVEPKRGKWILCDERLPEIGSHHISEAVWVTTDSGEVFVDELEENIFGQKCFRSEMPSPFGDDEETEVIAWMPIQVPEPYMRGESE